MDRRPFPPTYQTSSCPATGAWKQEAFSVTGLRPRIPMQLPISSLCLLNVAIQQVG
ncbi:hypothetical protein ACRRTK_024430 [Alexandromys fortis]